MNNKSLTTFYLVRHGQTEWNLKGLMQGHQDSPLTKDGENQALYVAKELGNIKFDLAFSSDLLRAKRTAEIIAKEHKLEIKVTQLLRERNFGDYEGKPQKELNIFTDYLDSLTHDKRFNFKFNSQTIESDNEISTRLITFLRETAILYPGKIILVVTHGGIIRALLIKLGYSTYHQLHHSAIENGAYLKLETDGVDFFIKEIKGVRRND